MNPINTRKMSDNVCPIAFHIENEGIDRIIRGHNPSNLMPVTKIQKAKHFKCGMGCMCNRNDKGKYKECVIK